MNKQRLRLILIILVIEKMIQHGVVTLALYFDVADIRDDLAVDYRILLISGFCVGLLFALSLWGLWNDKLWATNLITALALFDFVGEFVAQGKFMITCTVSFLVAFVLIVVSIRYRRLVRSAVS